MPKRKLTAAFVDKVSTDKQIDFYDENTPGLGLRVSPGGTKTFFYRYRFNGKNRRYSISRYSKKVYTLSKARIEVDQLRSNVKKGGDPVGEEQEKKKTNRLKADREKSFTELTQEFKKIHFKSLGKKTQDEYERIIDVEFTPLLGKMKANQVQKSQIIALLDNKAINQDKATMANRMRARLHTIYSFGIHRGIVETNPVSGIKPYPNGETKRERYYSEKEIWLIWKALNQINQPANSILKILFLTGQRKRETMEMEWNHLNGNIWTIPEHLAKNNKEHDVPLSDSAMNIIKYMKTINGTKTYVFNSPVLDDAPIKDISRSISKVKIFKEDDFSVPDFTMHDIRRTTGTHMAKLNISRTVLGKILNHKRMSGDDQVTAIYDRHAYIDEKRQALQKWAKHLNQITSENKDTYFNN